MLVSDTLRLLNLKLTNSKPTMRELVSAIEQSRFSLQYNIQRGKSTPGI